MKNLLRSIYAFFWGTSFCCLVLLGSSWAKTNVGFAQPSTSTVRTIIYPLTVKNLSPQVVTDAQIIIAGPHGCNLGQTVHRIEASVPFRKQQHDVLNHDLIFTLDAIPPFGIRQIVATAEVQLSSVPCQDEPLSPQRYLRMEAGSPDESKVFEGLVAELDDGHSFRTVENIISWIYLNLAKTTYSSPERGAVWALENRKGDCTEFAQLFVTLCRMAGIPARRISGYAIKYDRYLTSSDYHDWAQFFLDGRWHIADPYYNIFMQNEDHYVTTRVHTPLSAKGFFYRWKSSDERLKITMARP